MLYQVTLDDVFLLLLLGHVLGDFYFQTDRMVEGKKTNGRWLIAHALEYAACMAVILLLGVQPSVNVWMLIASACLVHFLIDWAKRRVKFNAWIERHLFVLDQCTHLAALIALWAVWGADLTPRWFMHVTLAELPARPIAMLLGVLVVLRPAGLLIGSGAIYRITKEEEPNEQMPEHAGRMIGYLERLIVLFFLIYKQFGAIAFVLTAKSLARFDEISKKQMKAEYYLIGTLLSVTLAFAVALGLGLARA